MSAAADFLRARDFLLAHRTDYAAVRRDFHLPQLSEFNWALDHFDALAPILRQWRPYFAPFASVEHHGCSLANVARTRAVMHKLADLWNVPVTAAFRDQWIPYDRSSAFRFQGRTYTAFPYNGALASWARSAATADNLCR